MKNLFGLLIVALMAMTVLGQADAAHFRAFDAKGKPVDVSAIIAAAENADVVFLGENHDDVTGHALQLQIFKALVEKYSKERKMALSMEMFERDVQVVLDEYLAGLISENHFLLSSRPWGNYKQDYRPLVEIAKAEKLPVIAANAPRRYINMVSRGGRDALNGLSKQAKAWLPPMPYNRPSEAYQKKFKALMGPSPEAQMGIDKIMDSQALWDATMAWSVATFLKKNKKPLVVHLNGAFHTENRLGTAEQTMNYRKKARVLVVSMHYDSDFTNFKPEKNTDLGDFVILTDASVPRSYKQ